MKELDASTLAMMVVCYSSYVKACTLNLRTKMTDTLAVVTLNPVMSKVSRKRKKILEDP